MSYLAGRPAKQAVEDSIIESLQAREAKMCETWDREKGLGIAFAVSAEIPQDEVVEVKSCMTDLSGGELLISDKVRVSIIKGDVKERKGKAMLIFRYQHMGGF